MAREGEIQGFRGISASRETGWGERLAAIAATQKERLFLFSPVCVGAGVCTYFALGAEPSWLIAGLPLLVLFPPVLLLWPRRLNNLAFYFLFVLLMAVLLAASGFALAKLRTHLVATPMLAKPIKVTQIEGRVASIEFLEEGEGLRFILKDLRIEKLSPQETPYSVRLKVRKGAHVRPGDRISVLGALNPPSAPVAPGAFDFQRHSYFRQIGAFGFAYRDPVVIKPADASLRLWLEHLRQQVGARLITAMPAREAGIANALMTGERAAISERDNQEMRDSGIFHIISISGLHISMIAGVVFFAVRFLMALFPTFALYHPIKKYAAVVALVVTVLYMLMVGATVPTVRSVIMTGIVLLAVMCDRIPLSLRVVAIAALLIVAMVPEAVIGASFQMSFMAVTGLVAFYEATRRYWVDVYRDSGWFRRGLIYLAGVCVTTVIASIATAPFSIYHFQQFANYGLLANLLAVPLTSFVVMPGILLAYVLMPFGLEGPALWLVGQGLSGMLWVSHMVAHLPHAVWNPPAWPVSALVSCALAGVLACLLQGWGRMIALLPLLAAAIFVISWQPPDVLVSASGKLMALRGADNQVYMSSRQIDKFSSDAWMRLLGHGDARPDIFAEGPLACDEFGCRYQAGARKVSFALHAGSHTDECAWADVLIADDPVRIYPCAAAVVIDWFDLWRAGAHAVWLDDLRVRSVKGQRGARLWTISHTR